MNEDIDLSKLEDLLEMKLPDNAEETLPIVTGIISQLIGHLNDPEPQVDELVDLTIVALLFFRTHIIRFVSEESEEQFIEVLNDFCQSLIDLLGYKLRYDTENSKEETVQAMRMMKTLLELVA